MMKRGWLTIGFVCVLLAGLGVFSNPALCGRFKSTSSFTLLPGCSRDYYQVFYEGESLEGAQRIAALLPEATAAIMENQYRPFKRPVRIYVCRSKSSCYSYIGSMDGTAATDRERIFTSPRLFSEAKPIAKILKHELSHVHLHQQMGLLRYALAFLSGVNPFCRQRQFKFAA